jgi:hypothetical protein
MTSEHAMGVSRRTALMGGAAAGAGVLAAVAGLAGTDAAQAAPGGLPYPKDVTDISHASPQVATILKNFFAAKSRHDPDAMMTHFAKKDAYYIDASSGSVWPSWDSLNQVFHAFLPPAPAAALSYPLRIVGDEHSAMVEFEDTPQLFGKELRILGSVTFDDKQKIVRWIDYWDGRSSLRTTAIAPSYPTYFKDDAESAAPQIKRAAQRLQDAFAAGDVATAMSLLSFDAVHEDMAAHTRVRGQLQIQRYYTRALASLPYGPGAELAHVEGSALGGGYEWHASSVAAPMRRGHTALELGADGLISRVTVVYDSALLTYPTYQNLVMLAAEAPM